MVAFQPQPPEVPKMLRNVEDNESYVLFEGTGRGNYWLCALCLGGCESNAIGFGRHLSQSSHPKTLEELLGIECCAPCDEVYTRDRRGAPIPDRFTVKEADSISDRLQKAESIF